jgi:hypothetical protein
MAISRFPASLASCFHWLYLFYGCSTLLLHQAWLPHTPSYSHLHTCIVWFCSICHKVLLPIMHSVNTKCNCNCHLLSQAQEVASHYASLYTMHYTCKHLAQFSIWLWLFEQVVPLHCLFAVCIYGHQHLFSFFLSICEVN